MTAGRRGPLDNPYCHYIFLKLYLRGYGAAHSAFARAVLSAPLCAAAQTGGGAERSPRQPVLPLYILKLNLRGYGAVGSAFDWQSKGHEFESR